MVENNIINPFTKDQVDYLVDKFTSLMMHFEAEERTAKKLKLRINEILKEIRSNRVKEGGVS